MSACAAIEIVVAAKNATQMNASLGLDVPAAALTSTAVTSPDAHRGVRKLIELLESVLAGSVDATVTVAVRDAAAVVAVSGNGISATYQLK